MAPRSMKCGACEKTFAKKEQQVDCSACKKKYHINCSKLSDDELKIFMSKTKLKWFCMICEDDVAELLTNFEKFRKVSATIEKIQNEIDAKVSNFEKRLTVCEANLEAGNVVKKIEEQVKKSSVVDKEELDLRKSKEENLIFFGLPESESDTIAERMKSDFSFLNNAYQNSLKSDDITSLFRIGKKSDKKRPLVVRFVSMETENAIMRRSGKSSIKNNNQIIPIYMSIDRTQKQCESHKQLVDELRRRKSQGEEYIVIRNEKIVQYFQKETATERTTWSSLFQ